jgi:hypothetical protein
VAGSGLSLGLETLGAEAACDLLARGGPGTGAAPEAAARGKGAPAAVSAEDATQLLRGFAEGELAGLKRLRGILAGDGAGDRSGDGATGGGPEQLEALLDRCDYLWAHFPDCAGTGGRRPQTGLGFLKRVRAEIDPFIAIFETLLLRVGGV